MNDGRGGLGQHEFQALGPGSSVCRAKYYYDFAGFRQNFHSCGSHGNLGRTTGFWGGRSELESQPLPTSINLINTTENRDTASLFYMRKFDTWNFLKLGKVPLRNFSVLRDKKISTGNRDIPSIRLPPCYP